MPALSTVRVYWFSASVLGHVWISERDLAMTTLRPQADMLNVNIEVR